MSQLMQYMVPIALIDVIFLSLYWELDLPITFMIIPLFVAGFGMFKLFLIERTRQQLAKKVTYK